MKAEVAVKRRGRWNKNCMVCHRLKNDKVFRERIFLSSYFTDNKESPNKVNTSFGSPFKRVTLYFCLRQHHGSDALRPATKVTSTGKVLVDQRFKPTFEVIESVPGLPTTNHELGLDRFIEKGRAKLESGEMQITATTYLQAIKVKMDNDAKTKDRRLDMLSGMFKGAAPKRDV